MKSAVDSVRQWWAGLGSSQRSVVAIGLVVLAAAALGGLRTVYEAVGRPDSAREYCETRLLEALKAPATAQFDDDPDITEVGEFGMRVEGHVDSQNGFGAMIRNRYVCQVSEVGDEWLLVDMELPDSSQSSE